MAYSCVKVQFEIGHEASIRAKRTPEGFTHDWEVFVRGVDNNEIYHFVEKVVFYLHETFPKPKRVVKEPPYSVKESGYAGFNLPIEIYFKNLDEPKKVRYNYDLSLQTSGPPISKVLKEQYVFPNPAEDLRRRLIKGGGVGVLGSESSFHLASAEKGSTTSVDDSASHKHPVPSLVGKPKLSSSGGSSDSNKKHKKESKIDEPRTSNSFHDLFGPPIKTKVSPDPKKSSHSPKVSPISKPSKQTEKSSSEKSEKSSKSSKHGSQREGKDSTERSSSTKEEKKEKDKSRDKDKNKEKPPKRPSTPVKPSSTPPKRPPSPPKRPPSPPPKRPPSPPKLLAPPATSKVPNSPKHLPSSKPHKNESKKSNSEEGKNRSESKSGESSKSEKKKKDKKSRDEKPKKDKHKEHEKSGEKKEKSEKSKEPKEKDLNKRTDKEKESEKSREKDKEKTKHNDGEKEKQRHKHKKKDKSNKDREKDKEKDRDKSSKKSSESKIGEVRDKEKNGLANESSRGSVDTSSDISASHKKAASSPSPSPVRAAVSPTKPSPTPEKTVSSVPVKEKIIKRPIALLSDDSSDSSSALSVDEDLDHAISRMKPLKNSDGGTVTIENKSSVLPMVEPPRPNSRNEIVKPKSENLNPERNSLNKSSSKQKEKSSKKSKERDSGGGDVEKTEKESKKRKRKSGSRNADEAEARNNGETPTKIPKIMVEAEEAPLEPEPVQEKAAMEEEMEIKEESETEEVKPPATHLTEEYVCQLRELQHKIMALEDNAELQRVVQVIAETGQYEITKKTFDFDLCALDRSTVKRLQEFFAPS